MPSPMVIIGNDLIFFNSDNVGFCIGRIIVIRASYVQQASKRDLDDTIKHELTHAWVYWKGLHSKFGGGHNKAFLIKAKQIGLDLRGVFQRYPETKDVYAHLE